MPNKNYNRGVEKERLAIEQLETVGYIAMRTAGSHGVFDVIGLSPTGIRFIQVKRGKEECDVIYDCNLAKEKMKDLPRLPNVSYEVWGWHDGKGWIVQEGEGETNGS